MLPPALNLPPLPSDEEVISPTYLERSLFLSTPEDVFSNLKEFDWSFVDDDTEFLAHDIHPYPAKFIPQIPGNMIALLSARGELVLDPFGGSGTTALEAIRLGRRALSIDANPLSELIGRTKTAAIDREAARELHGMNAALKAEMQELPNDPRILVERHRRHAPTIPNRDKWFADSAFGELCLIKSRIADLTTEPARDVALVALSRIALRASFQDSETRYKSVPRDVPVGETLRRFLKEFKSALDTVAANEAATRYGISKFLSADARKLPKDAVPDGSVDLIVTSPPYGNATDYHLYHRFRLLWLGHDPAKLATVEIGSHLKHQRERSGFKSYFTDLEASVREMARVLRAGRYAVLVLGNSIYEGQPHDPAALLSENARELGFDASCLIERPVHATKRSFTQAGRRATSEWILVLRRTPNGTRTALAVPPYKQWPYERILRVREIDAIAGTKPEGKPDAVLAVDAKGANFQCLRRLAFSHSVIGDGMSPEPTWQAVLENGGTARKDPKYVTHGLHPYKGKFYPQLAKGLLNLAKADEGAILLDPFCGSGTTLLEGYLGGLVAHGCDMNPLAAKIARAKTDILDTEPDVLIEAVGALQEALARPPQKFPCASTAFPEACLDEIDRWFPAAVVGKLAWLKAEIAKVSAGAVRDFLEVVLSSVIREVSQQEPTDLRIRYRKTLLMDADLFTAFGDQLAVQVARIESFWRVRGRAPCRFHRASTVEGDNRKAETMMRLGLTQGSVDFVLTSPPYATALPYIDTDRLSLLVLFGLSSLERRPLESSITGSREISPADRKRFDAQSVEETGLPVSSVKFLKQMRSRLAKDADAGFRKQAVPALLMRYLVDMEAALRNVHAFCQRGAHAMIVIADNRTEIGGASLRIPTTDLVEDIAESVGFERMERIDISVTTENYLHQKNAITENVVLHMRRV
jgi:DNA modification methylase